MILLDTLKVYYGSEERLIELYQGDLTNLMPKEAVDVLVVSAFPNDYLPTPKSLIGALSRKGVSVEELARSKAVDLRQTFSCWMSQEVIASHSGIQFKRILCFEPLPRGTPPEVVGDIFRALASFFGDEPPISTVASVLMWSASPVSNQTAPLPVRQIVFVT